MEKKERPLTLKEDAFCQEYVTEMNGTRAYMKAYKKNNPDIAAAEAHRLLRKHKVQKRVEELRAYTAGQFNITRERIAKEYARLAFADRRCLYDEHGNLKNIQDLNEDEAAVIDGIETVYDRTPGGELVLSETKKLKLSDRTRALDSLAKMLGYNEPEKIKAQVNGEMTGKIIIEVVPSGKQIDKKL